MNRAPGFTLVELLVSIGIFAFISTVSVANHSQFNSSILLTNLAYEVGLSIREAQIYGITVKQSVAEPAKFDSGYGIHFNLTEDPKSYVLFEDRLSGGNAHRYDDGSDTDIETFRIRKGNMISGIYIDGDDTRQTAADVAFIRPNPDAYITIPEDNILHDKAEICLRSPGGSTRKVVVEKTGQISVVADNVTICGQ